MSEHISSSIQPTVYLRIANWNDLYENAHTRKLKRLDWVCLPNKMDGDGYTELVQHKNGAEHYAAWITLLEVGSRSDPRGALIRANGEPHTPKTLGRITRLPEKVFTEAIPRLLKIKWLEEFSPNVMGDHPNVMESNPNTLEPSRARANGREGKEGNRTEGNIGASSNSDSETIHALAESIARRHPKKNGVVLGQRLLLQIAAESTDPVNFMRAVEQKHGVLCRSPDWKKQAGRYAPKLLNWVREMGYEDPVSETEPEFDYPT